MPAPWKWLIQAQYSTEADHHQQFSSHHQSASRSAASSQQPDKTVKFCRVLLFALNDLQQSICRTQSRFASSHCWCRRQTALKLPSCQMCNCGRSRRTLINRKCAVNTSNTALRISRIGASAMTMLFRKGRSSQRYQNQRLHASVNLAEASA